MVIIEILTHELRLCLARPEILAVNLLPCAHYSEYSRILKLLASQSWNLVVIL